MSEATMEVPTTAGSLIAKAFQASDSNPTEGSSNTCTEQYLVIPPDHVNEEVIVIENTAMAEPRVTRIRVNQKVEPETEEEEGSTVQPMDCSASSEVSAAASSIMDIQAASASKPLTFEVIDSASQRGLPKLMDSLGYGYTLRRTSNVSHKKRGKQKGKKEDGHWPRVQRMYWRCSVRGKQYSCGAGVVQAGENVFIRNDQPHGHLPKKDGLQQVKIRKQIKMLAKQNTLETSPSVVNSVLLDNADGDVTECSRSVHANLVRTANRIREKVKGKTELTIEQILKNVHEYFQNEERAGCSSHIGNPMKRLSEATGIPTRQLKKKLGVCNDKEIAIKRCIGGELKGRSADLVEVHAEDAISVILEDFELKGQSFSLVELTRILKQNYSHLNISRVVIVKVLRKLGYQILNSNTAVDAHVVKKPKKQDGIIKLVRTG